MGDRDCTLKMVPKITADINLFYFSKASHLYEHILIVVIQMF